MLRLWIWNYKVLKQEYILSPFNCFLRQWEEEQKSDSPIRNRTSDHLTLSQRNKLVKHFGKLSNTPYNNFNSIMLNSSTHNDLTDYTKYPNTLNMTSVGCNKYICRILLSVFCFAYDVIQTLRQNLSEWWSCFKVFLLVYIMFNKWGFVQLDW